MFVHVLFTFVHILPSFIEPTALTHNFHQNPSVTFTFLFKVVSLSSHLWNFFFEWKDEGLTLETSALENSSTQLRKPHGLLIKPHYCVIPRTYTATQFLQKFTAFVQFGIGHIEAANASYFAVCFTYYLTQKNLISIINFPFV